MNLTFKITIPCYSHFQNNYFAFLTFVISSSNILHCIIPFSPTDRYLGYFQILALIYSGNYIFLKIHFPFELFLCDTVPKVGMLGQKLSFNNFSQQKSFLKGCTSALLAIYNQTQTFLSNQR